MTCFTVDCDCLLFDYTKHVLIHQNKVSVSFCVVLETSLLIKEENINV